MIIRPLRPQVNELQQKMSRFHGLTASNPERKKVAAEVEHGVDSLRWQVRLAKRQLLHGPSRLTETLLLCKKSFCKLHPDHQNVDEHVISARP